MWNHLELDHQTNYQRVTPQRKPSHNVNIKQDMAVTVRLNFLHTLGNSEILKPLKIFKFNHNQKLRQVLSFLLWWQYVVTFRLCCKLLYCGKMQANVVDAAAMAVIVLLWRRLKLLLYCNHICSYRS